MAEISSVKVGKDGTVTRDGDVVGSVYKTQIGTSMHSLISGQPGPVRWVAVGTDGKKLSDDLRTKREAVTLVDRVSRPMVVTVELGTDWGGNPIWLGDVTIQGHSFGVSRYPSEGHWFVYYQQNPGAVAPSLCTSPGSRPAAAIVRDDVVAALDAAKKAVVDGSEK